MIAENLSKLRKHLAFAQNEFALNLGITFRAYVNYERGERKPPYDILIKLSNDYNVNLNWLIADKGEMFNAPKFDTVKSELRREVLQILKEEGVLLNGSKIVQ